MGVREVGAEGRGADEGGIKEGAGAVAGVQRASSGKRGMGFREVGAEGRGASEGGVEAGAGDVGS